MKNILVFSKRRIIRASEIVRLYSNWWVPFFAYIRFLRPKLIILILRNGVRYESRGYDFDAIAAINDVWMHHDYTPLGNEIKEGSVIIDIGAHIGSFSLFAANYNKDVQVYSYEPSKESYAILVNNVKLNNIANIRPFNLAVSKIQGEIKFYISEKQTTGHSIAITQGNYVIVNSTTLQHIFTDNNILSCNLLKLDCEGAEYEILFNTSREILNRIQNISMEYHDVPNYTINDLTKYLKNMGFDVRLGKGPFLYASMIRR